MRFGTYVPGRSLVHRAAAGHKLIGLAVFGTLLFLISAVWAQAVIFLMVFALYGVSGIGVRRFWDQIKALAVFLVLIGIAQWYVSGGAAAGEVVLRLASAVTAAALVTYTTPFSAMMAAFEQATQPLARAPLSGLGIRPAALSFALTTAVRFLPLLEQIVEETKEAAAVRGQERAWLALVIPALVRTVKLAHEAGEAMEARGVDAILDHRDPDALHSRSTRG